MKNNQKQLKLLIVSSVATSALPLISVAENKIAIQVQHYQENDDRITINDGKFSIEHDFGTDHTLNTEFDWDSISGASPTWDSVSGASSAIISDDIDGESGASPCLDSEGSYYNLCSDTRASEDLVGDGYKELSELTYKNVALDDYRNSLALLYTYRKPVTRDEIYLGTSYSKEGDFVNKGISAEYLMYTDSSKNRAFTIGASYMNNEVYDYIEDHWNEFDLFNTQFGITQVFNKGLVAKLNGYYMQENGHLSNPYFTVIRRINVAINIEDPVYFKYYLARDSRPDERIAGGISSQLVKEINSKNTIHASYRYYQDDWAVKSHTLDSKSYHRVGNSFRVSPGLRLYQQSAANFFKDNNASDNVFNETGYASADQRLSDNSSWTAQFAVEYFQNADLTWNAVGGYQEQTTGLTFSWVNFGAQYKY